MSRVEYRMPSRLDIPSRFFGRFTWKDLVRLLLPIILCFAVFRTIASPGAVAVLALTGVAGVAWYGVRPFGQYLDELVVNAVQWLAGRNSVKGHGINGISDDHVVTREGVVMGIIEVEPANLEMRTEPEQQALISVYRDLFESVSYPIYIYSRQEELSLDNYGYQIQQRAVDDYLLQLDYLRYIYEFTKENQSKTRHFIIVRVDRDNRHRLEKLARERLPFLEPMERESEKRVLVDELDSRCREVVENLNSAELSADRVTGEDLRDVLKSYVRTRPNPGIQYTTRPREAGTGAYRKSAYITEYPATIDAGWPVQLLRTDGLVDIVQVVEPRNSAKTTKKLQRLAEKLNAEIDSFLRQGYRGINKLEGSLADVEWFLDLLADREDKPVDYGVYVTAHHENEQRCKRSFEQVCSRLDTMQISYRQPIFRTHNARYTDSLVFPDRLDEKQLAPARSAAAGFPFSTLSLNQDAGVIYGTDTSDGSPILLDRFSWSSHSMARMGMVGSGKSYAAKIELLRSFLAYPDLQIILVDPKNEYGGLVGTLGGTTYTLSETGTEYDFDEDVVCFQVENRGQEENADQLVDLVQGIYAATSRNTQKTLVLIDEARILLNHETGRQVLNQFVLEGRDTNTAVTLITQNASHFAYCREGREILDNMPGKIFMRHDRVPESVVDYFDLSEREKYELFELKTGTDTAYSEGLVKVTGRIDARVRIEATDREHHFIEPSPTRPIALPGELQ